MRRQDEQRAIAHKIKSLAEDRRPLCGIVGYPTSVLLVLCVPKQGRADDLILDCSSQLGEGVADDGGALAKLKNRG